MIFKLVLATIALLLVSHTTCQTYTREFQLGLDMSYFDSSRTTGITAYFSAWSEAAGLNYSTLENHESVRQETTIDIDNCGGDGSFVRERAYVWGSWNGWYSIGIKSSGSLTQTQAENEPFGPSSQYASQAIEMFEYDIHPCEADWAANTRIWERTSANFSTCSDVDDYFPSAVSRSSESVESSKSRSYVFTAYRNGTYLGREVTLDVTLSYSSLDNAINDVNPSGGEFSFTMYNDDEDYTSEQTNKGIEIYNHLLDTFGSDREYPCADGTVVADFFDSNLNGDSAATTLAMGILFLIVLLVV